ncbi:CPBP family intramembrane metalloprotease [Corynebacterium sp. YIM 101645]|uniref:CPBP family intramembrane metalloprotease n=1 Tax=Corynebacterium lemuris TaxID=1859292 RepID=A0ABT2FVC9_9CORY|nr:CPBP family intramembrane glutamic endopeptidase [Corynebacterium lemuris]MCS5479198.1 CPBP family intramembrane metalloprotease [Corynebacterium lemuris]
MLMLAIWCLPTLVDLTARRGAPAAFRRNGLIAAGWWWIGWGVVAGLLGFLAGHVAAMNIPASALGSAGLGGLLGVAAAAAGEEIFFRGFLQGWLDSRWGVRAAVWGQAVAFLLPHLLLVLVEPALWVLLPVQFLIGLALGMLRWRSGSVWPAVVAHVLTNVTAGLLYQ